MADERSQQGDSTFPLHFASSCASAAPVADDPWVAIAKHGKLANGTKERILNAIYPYGELFVIVKGSPQESKPPRIVWRARKMLVAEDAIRDLIKALKALRGES